MNMYKSVMAAIVAVSMVVVPTAVQAAAAHQSSASKLSVRSAQQVRGFSESKMGEGSNTAIYIVGGLAAAIGLYFLVRSKSR